MFRNEALKISFDVYAFRATMAFYFFPTSVRTAIFSMTLWHRKLQAVTERCEKYSVRIPK